MFNRTVLGNFCRPHAGRVAVGAGFRSDATRLRVKGAHVTMGAPVRCRSHAVPLSIRAARPADLPDLAAWNVAMAWETEHRQLDHDTVQRGVAAVFEQPRRGFYLVCERDGVAVGSLMVTYEWSDWRNGDFWWIQSVYVCPDARRGGVFRALYAAVLQRATTAAAVGVRLYVETENRRAQATYEGLGMEACHYAMYEAML
jgi:ribosomal protein S18 acetylase RimI-like enzyme